MRSTRQEEALPRSCNNGWIPLEQLANLAVGEISGIKRPAGGTHAAGSSPMQVANLLNPTDDGRNKDREHGPDLAVRAGNAQHLTTTKAAVLAAEAMTTKAEADMDHNMGLPEHQNTAITSPDEKALGDDCDSQATISALATPATQKPAEDNATIPQSTDPPTTDGSVVPLVKEFICQIDTGCRQTQFLLKESRKCISDHFGRNKKCTRLIKDPIIWCRSCYQRKAYQKGWPAKKMSLIREQLRRIEFQEPGVTYTVALKQSEQERLNRFNNGAGTAEPTRNPNDKAYRAPLAVLQNIYSSWVNTGAQTLNDCLELVDYIQSLWSEDPAQRQIEDIPSFEMLPNFQELNAKDNYGKAKAAVIPNRAPRNFANFATATTQVTTIPAAQPQPEDDDDVPLKVLHAKKRKAADMEDGKDMKDVKDEKDVKNAEEAYSPRPVKKAKFSLAVPPAEGAYSPRPVEKAKFSLAVPPAEEAHSPRLFEKVKFSLAVPPDPDHSPRQRRPTI